LDKAEAAYRTGFDLGDGEAVFYLGMLLRGQGRFDEAEAAYRTGIDLGDRWAPNYLGDLLEKQGRFDEAEAAFEAARSLGFEDPAGDAAAKRA
jgi:tetratricopeptide (TPR) repeat protein